MYFSLLPLPGPRLGAAQTSSFQHIQWLVQAARTGALTAGSGVSVSAALSPMAYLATAPRPFSKGLY